MSTIEPLERAFLDATAALAASELTADLDGPVRAGSRLTGATALGIFASQLGSRQLDVAARWLRVAGQGFYTIGSAGHEGNAAVAAALRPDRSRPCCTTAPAASTSPGRARARAADRRRSTCCSGWSPRADEPIAGGRHKVFGHPDLAVIPQTSTIASHLPRALGVGLRHRPRPAGSACARAWPDDAIVVCSFGDASANHSTATGAINTAGHWRAPGHAAAAAARLRGQRPRDQRAAPRRAGSRPCSRSRRGLEYRRPTAATRWRRYDGAREAAEHVREHRMPALLHLARVRFMGHAGSDVESAYRSAGRDPAPTSSATRSLATARAARATPACSPPSEVRLRYERAARRRAPGRREAVRRPQLATAERGDGAARAAHAAAVAAAAARRRATPSARPGASAASCPRTRAR